MERVIYHADCNGFYAAVECLDRPELLAVPLAVAGDPKDRGGIILAKNELAKRFGIKTTETIWQARRKCPELVLVAPRHNRYREVSGRVKALFGGYTDQVESFGMDEAWLDVTGSLRYFGASPVELADRIREHVKREIGITVSVGVSFNKVFAKLGSDLKKPDATTLISRENYRELVWPLPVRDLLYVGKAAAEELERHVIRTIGDLARFDRDGLVRILGKGGGTLWRYANGLDDEPVRRIGEQEPVKSIGNGMTFRRDLRGEEEIRAGVIALSDEVATRLREEGVRCGTVQVLIKDPAFKSISRQTSLRNPTWLQKELVDTAMALIRANWRMSEPVRALTVTATHLVRESEAQEQLSFLELGAQRQTEIRDQYDRLEKTMQSIRKKHGAASIAMGYVHNEELGIRQFDRDEGPGED